MCYSELLVCIMENSNALFVSCGSESGFGNTHTWQLCRTIGFAQSGEMIRLSAALIMPFNLLYKA